MKPLSMKLEFGFGSPLDLILTGEKPSLLTIFSGNRKLTYGPPTTMVIQPPSSGEESEDELPLPTGDPGLAKLTP